MFDTMTFTKIIGGLCGALLIYLLGAWVAEALYHTGGGHGDDHHAQGYVIEIADAEPAEEVVEVAFADVLASADVGKGEKVFGKCKACHKLENGANSTGPYLYGIVDRTVGGADGFTSYSGALNAVGDTWTAENLNAFLEKPKAVAPGTSMTFSGLKKVEDRANLIAFLQTLSN